jgi:hypothetical protein
MYCLTFVYYLDKNQASFIIKPKKHVSLYFIREHFELIELIFMEFNLNIFTT